MKKLPNLFSVFDKWHSTVVLAIRKNLFEDIIKKDTNYDLEGNVVILNGRYTHHHPAYEF